jgi:tellurite resistance protein TerC
VEESIVSGPLPWIAFTSFIVVMLVLDLGVLQRKAHAIRPREAAVMSLLWISLAFVFNAGVWYQFGSEKAMEFLTGFLIEKALSVDNLFVFLATFAYFAVDGKLQHRVLFWGVLGALVMRGVFILVGGALIEAFHWILYVFGAFLIVTAVKLMVQKETSVQPERNPVLRLFRRLVPAVPDYRGTRFLVREAGRIVATPLLFVLVVIEATDVMFALDSIPAVFAVTTDTFIVYTSNIFAILGLRALYFLLAGYLDRFRFLNVGLALVLGFVGAKMLVAEWVKVPIGVSLGVVALLIGGSVAMSMLIRARRD